MRRLLSIILVCAVVFVAYHSFVSAPAAFPLPYHLSVTAGETSSSISRQLANDGVIRSRRTFQFFMVMLGNDTHISEGEYYFSQPLSAMAITLRISGKEFGITKTKVTFPEGYTNDEMASRLVATFPIFDSASFLTLAETSQGKLFPDTYKFFPTPNAEEVVNTMQHNYEAKLAPLRADIAATRHSEAEIIVMASLIQKEAAGAQDSPIIAGILWKRISDGMDLQVDAAPSTYSHKGLPATPINNPGLVAILAAIHPVVSNYVYYLHDSSGTIHYASTYQQHQQNIKKYLK